MALKELRSINAAIAKGSFPSSINFIADRRELADKSLDRGCGPRAWVEGLGLLAQDSVDSREHQSQLGGWELAHALSKEVLIDADDQGNVGHGSLRQTGKTCGQMDVSRGQGPFEIAGQRNTDDCGHVASIQCVTLHDDDRPSEPRTRTRRGGKIRPPDLAL